MTHHGPIHPPSPSWQIGSVNPNSSTITISGTSVGTSLPWVTTGSSIFVSKKSRDLSWKALRKLALAALDLLWLRKLASNKRDNGFDMPETVLRKLLAQGLVEVKLTRKGKREAFIDAVREQ